MNTRDKIKIILEEGLNNDEKLEKIQEIVSSEGKRWRMVRLPIDVYKKLTKLRQRNEARWKAVSRLMEFMEETLP